MHSTVNKKIVIFLAGFLFSLALAFTTYINSSFLSSYVSTVVVGFIYGASSFLSILVLFKLPHLLDKFGAQKIALYSSGLAFVSFLLLALGAGKILSIIAFTLNVLAINLLIATLDIFIEYLSQNKNVGKFRGLYLSVINTAWVLSQILSGSIINKSSFGGVYVLSSFFMLLTMVIFSVFLRDFKDPNYTKSSPFLTIKKFIFSKNLGKIYLLNFILKFFFAWMGIYTPIYLNQFLGFSWSEIGLIFAIMLTPFVFLSYPLGKLSDKYGEKVILCLGFLISSIAVFVMTQIKEAVFVYWAGILFASRVGAASIEVMTESYFFKIENEEDADTIGFFRNTHSLSYLLAPLCASVLLILTSSFQTVLLALVGIMLIGLLISLGLRDVK